MFQLDPRFGNYLWLERDQKLVPLGPGEPLEGTLPQEDLALAERYRLWCQRAHNFYSDCLGGALVSGRYLDMQGRYVWALAMSKSPVLDEMKKALGEMVEVRALISAALWTLGSMLLIMALNPVAPAQVAVQAEGQAGISLPALGAVEEIALSAEGVSVTVAATAISLPKPGSDKRSS